MTYGTKNVRLRLDILALYSGTTTVNVTSLTLKNEVLEIKLHRDSISRRPGSLYIVLSKPKNPIALTNSYTRLWKIPTKKCFTVADVQSEVLFPLWRRLKAIFKEFPVRDPSSMSISVGKQLQHSVHKSLIMFCRCSNNTTKQRIVRQCRLIVSNGSDIVKKRNRSDTEKSSHQRTH